MKSMVSIICLILICFTLAACSETEDSSSVIITSVESNQNSKTEDSNSVIVTSIESNQSSETGDSDSVIITSVESNQSSETEDSDSVIVTSVESNQSSETEDSNSAIITSREPNRFSQKEIDEAVDCVKEKFKDFVGCELTALWYDEEQSNFFVERYMSYGRGSINGVCVENVIVLLSNFDVDSSGGNGSLEPNSTCSNWNWILIRDSKTSKWEVDDWGY